MKAITLSGSYKSVSLAEVGQQGQLLPAVSRKMVANKQKKIEKS